MNQRTLSMLPVALYMEALKRYPCRRSKSRNSTLSYGYTKLINEQIAENYSNNFSINSIGLRFSVYGPLGRPDMAYYSFTKDIDEGNEISIYNDGQMSRDMTYVSDIVDGILKSINRLGDNKRNMKFSILEMRTL